MSSSLKNASDDLIPYSVELPSDLPTGGWGKDKFGFPQYMTSNQIRRTYLSLHREGWDECLEELGSEWNLDRNPMFIKQAYEWEERGYRNGYKACQQKVKDMVANEGEDQARKTVQKALQARGKK